MSLFYIKLPFFRRKSSKQYERDLIPSEAFRDFAAARSHADAQASNETGKSTAQASILINGGAATALLAYFAKGEIRPKELTCSIASCLFLYALGILCGAAMIVSRLHALDEYAARWRYVAFPESHARSEEHREKAYKLSKRAEWCFVGSMGCFVLASIGVATVLVYFTAWSK